LPRGGRLGGTAIPSADDHNGESGAGETVGDSRLLLWPVLLADLAQLPSECHNIILPNRVGGYLPNRRSSGRKKESYFITMAPMCQQKLGSSKEQCGRPPPFALPLNRQCDVLCSLGDDSGYVHFVIYSQVAVPDLPSKADVVCDRVRLLSCFLHQQSLRVGRSSRAGREGKGRPQSTGGGEGCLVAQRKAQDCEGIVCGVAVC
jgi:hypothetical protein